MHLLLTPLLEPAPKPTEAARNRFMTSVSAGSEAPKGKSYVLKVSHLPDPIPLLLPAMQRLSLCCRAQRGLDAVHTSVNMMSLWVHFC